MLPKFPQFKKLELSDKYYFEEITSKFLPYSDFNFVSLWSWNTEGSTRVSMLNENLTVRFIDYITNEPFYSFLGDNLTTDTVEKLLALSKNEGLKEELKLLPELSLSHIDNSLFTITENRDHFDYILSLEKLADYETHHITGHASFNRRFISEHEQRLTIKLLDLHNTDHQNEVLSLTTIWMENKVKQNKTFLAHLEDAVKRYLFITEEKYHENFVSIGVFIDNKLIAFTINELVDSDYCICHFMKGDNSYKGIYSHLVTKTSQELLKTGRKYINFEQDLGLKNLRQSKKTFEPINFLKKFTIAKNNNILY